MSKQRQFFIEVLQKGPLSFKQISRRMKEKFSCSAVSIRDELIENGVIQEHSFYIRKDGKRECKFELTGKGINQEILFEIKKPESMFWEDGTPKSKFNAFDWKNTSIGLYSSGELSAVENGRRWGIKTSNAQVNVYSKARA